MKRTKVMVLLVLFAALSLASLISVYYTHQLPTEKKTTTPLCYYVHTGKYDYIAKLVPNTLYSQSTLTPGEGTLYTKIIDHVNITFTYTFTCNRPTNTTSMECKVNTHLESPENWAKTFTPAEITQKFQAVNTINLTEQAASTTMFLSPVQINELVRTIDGQIGTRTSQYNLVIETEVYLTANISTANADVRAIYERFNHTVTVEFRTETQNRIAIENLKRTKPDNIEQTEITPYPWVTNQRNMSIAFCATSISALTITAFYYMKTRPVSTRTQEEKKLKKILKKYKEIVAETKEEPLHEPKTTTIEMATIEDLAKISEALMKPILYIKKDSTPQKTIVHTFYIIDKNTKYQYQTT
jgi:hypothetical protein